MKYFNNKMKKHKIKVDIFKVVKPLTIVSGIVYGVNFTNLEIPIKKHQRRNFNG